MDGLRARHLLYLLERNCRTPLTAIAKKLGVSPQAVGYQLESLQRKGVIKSFLAVVEYKKLGYTNYSVYYRLRALGEKKRKKMLAHLCSRPEVSILVTSYGKYDLIVSALCSSVYEFDDFLTDFESRYAEHLAKRDFSTHIGAYGYGRKYLWPEEEKSIISRSGVQELPERLSKKDLQMLSVISYNARASLGELGAKLGLTPEAVAYRLKKLEKQGVIQAYSVFPDTSVLGFDHYRVLLKFKRFTETEKKRLKQFCLENENVLYYVQLLGSVDAFLWTEVEEGKINEFMEKLSNVVGDIMEDYEILEMKKVLKFGLVPTGELR